MFKKNKFYNKIVVKNKKAFYDYFIENSIETGISLLGTEVKSIKQGNINIRDSYAIIENYQVFLYGMHIKSYVYGNYINHNPIRKRKLLLHKREIRKLYHKLQEKGFTLIPLKIFLKKTLIKVELGVVKGKKNYDKRNQIKEKYIKQEIKKIL